MLCVWNQYNIVSQLYLNRNLCSLHLWFFTQINNYNPQRSVLAACQLCTQVRLWDTMGLAPDRLNEVGQALAASPCCV